MNKNKQKQQAIRNSPAKTLNNTDNKRRLICL